MMAIGHNNGPPVDWRDYGGFIVEARDSRDHPIVGYGRPVKPADDARGSYSYNEAWRDLLHECRYQDGFVLNGGQKMLIRRGELVGAVSWLANRWNWSPKAVRVFLDKLETDGMIARFRAGSDQSDTDRYKGNRNGNQANVLRVSNYDKFNTPQPIQQQSAGQSSGNRAAIEGQSRGHSNKDNKLTREQTNKTSIDDLRALEKQLLEACNGALDNPVNCQGLLSMAIPKMWIADGCDLQMDILPTLKAVGQKAHGRRIQTWNYFTKAVGDAKRNREKGLITFNEVGEVETKAERLKRMAADIEQEHRK
jgi:DNA-binding Lrp family transcriptional regulator